MSLTGHFVRISFQVGHLAAVCGTNCGHTGRNEAVLDLRAERSAATLEPLKAVRGIGLNGGHSHDMLLGPCELADLRFDDVKS